VRGGLAVVALVWFVLYAQVAVPSGRQVAVPSGRFRADPDFGADSTEGAPTLGLDEATAQAALAGYEGNAGYASVDVAAGDSSSPPSPPPPPVKGMIIPLVEKVELYKQMEAVAQQNQLVRVDEKAVGAEAEAEVGAAGAVKGAVEEGEDAVDEVVAVDDAAGSGAGAAADEHHEAGEAAAAAAIEGHDEVMQAEASAAAEGEAREVDEEAPRPTPQSGPRPPPPGGPPPPPPRHTHAPPPGGGGRAGGHV